MAPEIAEPRGAEDRVADGVGADVGVGVAEKAVALELDPAEHEPAARREPVAVVADAGRDGRLEQRAGAGEIVRDR